MNITNAVKNKKQTERSLVYHRGRDSSMWYARFSPLIIANIALEAISIAIKNVNVIYPELYPFNISITLVAIYSYTYEGIMGAKCDIMLAISSSESNALNRDTINIKNGKKENIE